MRQEVNLYTQAFRPSREWLTLGRTTWLTIFVLAVVLAVAGWLRYELDRLQARQAELEASLSDKEQRVASLSEKLEQQQRDPQLEDRVERLEARVADRRNLVEKASSVARASSEGFTPYFRGLARQSREGLWLTRVRVNLVEDTLRVEGKTLLGQEVPEYLGRLRQETVFDGRRFARFGIDRDEEDALLNFSVASRRTPLEEEE